MKIMGRKRSAKLGAGQGPRRRSPAILMLVDSRCSMMMMRPERTEEESDDEFPPPLYREQSSSLAPADPSTVRPSRLFITSRRHWTSIHDLVIFIFIFIFILFLFLIFLPGSHHADPICSFLALHPRNRLLHPSHQKHHRS